MERAAELGLSYTMLLQLVEMEATPFVLRAECCRLLCALYIDVEPHRTVPTITPIRTWSSVATSTPMPRVAHAVHVPVIAAPALNGGDCILMAGSHPLDNRPAALQLNGAAEAAERVQAMPRADAIKLKQLLADEVRKLAEAPVQRSATAKGLFREEYMGGVVHVISQLLRFGFYHAVDEAQAEPAAAVPYWQAADLQELGGIATGLFAAMEAGLAALRRSEAQSVLAARRQQLIVSNAETVLALMTELLLHGISLQVPWPTRRMPQAAGGRG